ncbi:hypothetical protein E4T47_05939 [Aureobasidium subglaciale]|nr:hypothetical protein E4T47_05939 [Aureobasidium subglaciale]
MTAHNPRNHVLGIIGLGNIGYTIAQKAGFEMKIHYFDVVQKPTRGILVDEDALVHALETGHIFAAGLNVFANEPALHSELREMRSVTLTCHIAGGAIGTNYGFERLVMENVEALLLTSKALTPVNAHLIKSIST